MSGRPHLLVHDHSDNVGVVVVEGLTAGTEMLCCVTHDNSTFHLTAWAGVPIGRKIALKDLRDGDTVIKYGEDIGKIIADIKQGGPVRTHNCKTKRWWGTGCLKAVRSTTTNAIQRLSIKSALHARKATGAPNTS